MEKSEGGFLLKFEEYHPADAVESFEVQQSQARAVGLYDVSVVEYVSQQIGSMDGVRSQPLLGCSHKKKVQAQLSI